MVVWDTVKELRRLFVLHRSLPASDYSEIIRVCVCVCVCVSVCVGGAAGQRMWEGASCGPSPTLAFFQAKHGVGSALGEFLCVCVCVCLSVSLRKERKKERECVCVCVCA